MDSNLHKIVVSSSLPQTANQDPSKLSPNMHILDYYVRGVDINSCTNRTKKDENKTNYYADECACLSLSKDLMPICMEGYNTSEKAISQSVIQSRPNEAISFCIDDNNVPEKYRQDPNTHRKLAYQIGCLNSIHGPMSARPKE